jgi:membrane-bound lytic murein transglycosylase F
MTRLRRFFFTGILSFATLVMNGCDAIYWNESASLARVREKNEIRVLTISNPLTYATDKTGQKFGIDHDLLQNFAEHYDLKLRFIPVKDEAALKTALATGDGDIAAARLPTPESGHGFLIGPAYEDTVLSLFCQRKLQVASVADLNGRSVSTLSKDSNETLRERLEQLAPTAHVNVSLDSSGQKLFRNMAAGKTDCVMAENLEGEFFARYYKNVEKVTVLTDSFSLSWLVHPAQTDLNRLLQAWFQRASRDDEVMRIRDRYMLYFTELKTHDVLGFLQKSRNVMPFLKADFRDSGKEHGVPWQLIAAVCYQESQWDSDAVSFTGVRGLMQLTQETADHLGVKDRTDQWQSIWGGAKYLRFLLDRTPAGLDDKDRMALALASYNIGYGHLADAQKIAQQQGKNPYSWRTLRTILPLLEDKAVADTLEFGGARGTETVSFVERVMGFYSLLVVANQ